MLTLGDVFDQTENIKNKSISPKLSPLDNSISSVSTTEESIQTSLLSIQIDEYESSSQGTVKVEVRLKFVI